MLSKKYYKMIAKVIKDNTENSHCYYIDKEGLISALCYELKKDNNLFNKDTFVNACD